MSSFFMPHQLLPDAKEMEANFDKMTRDVASLLPKEFYGTANLMAHPLAASAAMTAFGLGLAGQMVGVWAGAVAGSMDAARRMSSLAMPGLAAEDEEIPAYKAPKSPAVRVRAALETIVEDTVDAARKVVDVAAESVEAAAAKPAAPASAGAVPPVAEPAASDDLKAISGIGPKLEQVLKGLGYGTYAQIAALTAAEIAGIEAELGFPGRVARDDWMGQARTLAGTAGGKA